MNLMGIILLISLVGSFITNLNFTSIVIMFSVGFLGYFMKRYGYSIVATTLGVVLGEPIESNLRYAMNVSKGDPRIFITDPLSLIFLILAVLILLVPAIGSLLKKRNSGKTRGQAG